MTSQEIDDFITHSRVGFVPLATMFGSDYLLHAIEVAEELKECRKIIIDHQIGELSARYAIEDEDDK
jgi:hypothetical protein